jgi:hypothetical protein
LETLASQHDLFGTKPYILARLSLLGSPADVHRTETENIFRFLALRAELSEKAMMGSLRVIIQQSKTVVFDTCHLLDVG